MFNEHGPQMAGSQFFTFCVALAAMLALAAALYRFELLGKRLDAAADASCGSCSA